jgi:hypothetical protein
MGLELSRLKTSVAFQVSTYSGETPRTQPVISQQLISFSNADSFTVTKAPFFRARRGSEYCPRPMTFTTQPVGGDGQVCRPRSEVKSVYKNLMNWE